MRRVYLLTETIFNFIFLSGFIHILLQFLKRT